MNNIRITSGEYRGRKIATPGGKTHPMGERERIALFNMIVDYLPGAVVLDAYAGSGALGIEALSRGASRVVFIENTPLAVRTIKENLHSIEAEAEVVLQNVVDFTTSERFDVIIADPPYDDYDLDGVNKLTPFLKEDGVLVLSHPGEAPEVNGLHLKKSRSYAGATISFFVKA